MSNPVEPGITLAYWQSLSATGKLYLEFPLAKLGYVGSKRRVDGVIVLGKSGDKIPHSGKDAPSLKVLRNSSVILIQTKRKKLGMGLAGQAIISRKLFESAKIDVQRSVALCHANDPEIGTVLRELGCEVFVYKPEWAKVSRS